MRLGLVIFDWAGTAIDFGGCGPTSAVMKTFASFGVAVTPAQVASGFDLTSGALIDRLVADPNLRWLWKHRHGKEPTPFDAQALMAQLLPRLVAAAAEHDRLIPGAAEMMDHLRARGLQVGSATGVPREVAMLWAEAAFRQGFSTEALLTGDDVPTGRPAPWMVYRLMEWLNVYPPAGVVKVSGSRVGATEGRNASCWSIAVLEPSAEVGLSEEAYGGLAPTALQERLDFARSALLAAGAHVVIPKLSDLPAALDDIAARLERGERP